MGDNNLVFIIDDDVIQNEIHALLIKKLFPEKKLSTFTRSTDALNAIESNILPDMIFLDLHLPGESETFFLDEYVKRGLKSKIYLMSSATYLKNRSLLERYPQILGFMAKPLLDHKLKEAFAT